MKIVQPSEGSAKNGVQLAPCQNFMTSFQHSFLFRPCCGSSGEFPISRTKGYELKNSITLSYTINVNTIREWKKYKLLQIQNCIPSESVPKRFRCWHTQIVVSLIYSFFLLFIHCLTFGDSTIIIHSLFLKRKMQCYELKGKNRFAHVIKDCATFLEWCFQSVWT